MSEGRGRWIPARRDFASLNRRRKSEDTEKKAEPRVNRAGRKAGRRESGRRKFGGQAEKNVEHRTFNIQ